jgi:hypothetical protein
MQLAQIGTIPATPKIVLLKDFCCTHLLSQVLSVNPLPQHGQ